MKTMFRAAAALVAVMATTAATQDGDDDAFTLVNRSGVAISQFNGYAGGRWSSNWLRYQIPVGGSQALRFNANATDACEVRARVTFLDESYFEDVIDFCGITYLYVSNDTMWTE